MRGSAPATDVDGKSADHQERRRPERGHRRSTTIAVIAGGGAVALVLVGSLVVLLTGGIWKDTEVARSLQSGRLAAVCWAGAAMGAVGLVTGGVFYRRVDTRRARNTGIAGAVLGLLGVLLGISIFAFTRGDMVTFARNFMNFGDIRGSFGAFGTGIKNTVTLATLSIVFGILIGLPVGCLLISRHAVVRAPARAYVNIIRGTPVLLQLSMVYFGLSLGLGLNWSAYTSLIFGMAINAGAYSAEVFRAGLQSIDRGQLDASRGLGLNYWHTLRYILVPQAVRRVIPPLLNEFIGLIKDTSLITFLGVSLDQRDIFATASTGYSQYYNATFYVAAGIGYLVVTIPLIRAVNAVERRLRRGLVGVA